MRKGIVVIVLNYHTKKMYVEVEVQIHVFVMLELGEGEWPASPPGNDPPVPIG
jgi:hypothetical protein